MNSEELLISVIVPIYKVEEFLSQCIESLLRQTYQRLEILLIDDGSPDNCGKLCDAYAKKDSRVLAFHKQNGGNSDALNYGICRAKGEYLAFVDGDDYIDNNDAFCLLITEAIRSDADIIQGNYHKDIQGKLIPTKEHGFVEGADCDHIDFRLRGFYTTGHLAYTWGKLYRRAFLLQHGLKLKTYVYALDKLFNVECYLHGPKYGFISDSVYVYRMNQASVSHKYKENFSDLWIRISEEIYTDIRDLYGGEDYMDFVAYNLLFAVFFSCKQEYQYQEQKIKAVIEELKRFRKHPLVRWVTKDILRGKYLGFHGLRLWKLMLWGISFGLYFKLYWIVALGIKILVDYKIDGSLSSTGKVE